MLCNGLNTPLKVPLLVGASALPSTAWFHPTQHPKWHVDRSSHFCRAHNCDRQTNTPCYSVCNNRLHNAA